MKNAQLKSSLAAAVLVACVVVPFLFWHGTWFGRPLENAELQSYLADTEKPRRVQHALTQVASRMERRDPTVEKWYPSVSTLAKHPFSEVRSTAAWVMGKDPKSELFHETLLFLLQDPETDVRRNAALSLVSFGDRSGLAELRSMLQISAVTAPSDGRVQFRVDREEVVEKGAFLLETVNGDRTAEVSAPESGQIQSLLVREGSMVSAGQNLLTLSPRPEHMWEALRALYLIGGAEELELVGTVASNPQFSEEIHSQAYLTSRSIYGRLQQESTGTADQ